MLWFLRYFGLSFYCYVIGCLFLRSGGWNGRKNSAEPIKAFCFYWRGLRFIICRIFSPVGQARLVCILRLLVSLRLQVLKVINIRCADLPQPRKQTAEESMGKDPMLSCRVCVIKWVASFTHVQRRDPNSAPFSSYSSRLVEKRGEKF